MTCAAIEKLRAVEERVGAMLSIGLEPAPDYLPRGFSATPAGYLDFFRLVIDATSDLAAAYKPNLAFFETMGSQGWRLLEQVRELVPSDIVFIADAKRSDVGSTARRSAQALYEVLGADAATVNPLMGRDSVAPFLAYEDKLTFFLVLTSNPGADDFLLPGNLYLTIATRLLEWNKAGNAGFVVGATRPERMRAIRAIAPGVMFLTPGVGAQGGAVEEVAAAARTGGADVGSGLLFHITRSLLPADDSLNVGDAMRSNAEACVTAIRGGLEREVAHG